MRKLSISITKCTENVSMASASLTSESLGYCFITFSLNGKVHNDVKVCVLNNLWVDLILDIDFQQQHKSGTIHFGG